MVSVEADVLGEPPDNPELLLGFIERDVQDDDSLPTRLAHRTWPSLVEPPTHGWRGLGDW